MKFDRLLKNKGNIPLIFRKLINLAWGENSPNPVIKPRKTPFYIQFRVIFSLHHPPEMV